MKPIFTVVVICVILSATVLRSDEASRAKVLDRLRREAVGATDREAATSAFQSLFAFANSAELSRLTNDSDIGVALYARHAARTSTDVELLSASHPERFVGFVEGRTGLQCPPNWANKLVFRSSDNENWKSGAVRTYGPLGLITYLKAGNSTGLGVPVAEYSTDTLHSVVLAGRSFECRSDITVTDDRIVIGDIGVPLRAGVLGIMRNEREIGRLDRMQVCIGPDQTFIAFWTTDSVGFPLICLDTSTGKVRWISDVWASRSVHRTIFGYIAHHVEIRVGQRIVGVFGIDEAGSYVEGFDIGSGNPAFRFNQRLWHQQ